MSNYPILLDDNLSLPFVNDNITEIDGYAINSIKDAVISIETEVGIAPKGVKFSLANRLLVSINNDGLIKPSALEALGYATLPIYNKHVSNNAQIQESKLLLDYSTLYLYNEINNQLTLTNSQNSFFTITGSKVNPHINGEDYKHNLSNIFINSSYLNKYGASRTVTNSFSLSNDINNEFLYHQKADGIGYDPELLTSINYITTLNGKTYSDYHAHHAEAVYLENKSWSLFSNVYDAQQLADYINDQSLLLSAFRFHNLQYNGISRSSRSSSLLFDTNGTILVPDTSAITYLLNNNSSSPVDDIDNGDDIIRLTPGSSLISSYQFDAWFSRVKQGDTIVVKYNGYSSEYYFTIKEVKYSQTTNRVYQVRINGKNIAATTAVVRIEKSLFYINKGHVLAIAEANNSSDWLNPSLIAVQPRGASVVGKNLNLNLLSSTRYNLYLELYPTGNPVDYALPLPAIDVTGNAGITPGSYTLQSVINTINNAFRQDGFNYRFVAFSYNGELGIALADSFNNASFSINNNALTNNVIGTTKETDPLGFSESNSNLASPRYVYPYTSISNAVNSTKVIAPLKRNNYYVNGSEREKFAREYQTILDNYGDGYWIATIVNQQTILGNIKNTYRVSRNLASAKLFKGCSIVVQPEDGYFSDYNDSDYGRFVVESVNHVNTNPLAPYTDITTYSSVHAQANPLATVSGISSKRFRVYFCDDSVSINNENSSDFAAYSPFHRFHHIFADYLGKTLQVERARYSSNGGNITVNGVTLYGNTNITNFRLLNVSKGLKGYLFSGIRKITLSITSYNSTSGSYSGYICKYDGIVESYLGKLTSSQKGKVTRFYDTSEYEYIDVILPINTVLSTFSNQRMDIQLFDSLDNDGELMLLANSFYDYNSNKFEVINDLRQFGTISEKNLTTSAINFINAGDKYFHQNGILSGFDNVENLGNGKIRLSSGKALVNGKILEKRDSIVSLPNLSEEYNNAFYTIIWVICLNDQNNLELYPLLDYDSNIGNVNAGDRLVRALNNTTLEKYNLLGYTFSKLIQTRKDLLPLFIYNTNLPLTVSLSVNPITVYAGQPFTITATFVTPDGSLLVGNCEFSYYDYSLGQKIVIGVVAISSNQAAITTSIPTSGTYTLYAVFLG